MICKNGTHLIQVCFSALPFMLCRNWQEFKSKETQLEGARKGECQGYGVLKYLVRDDARVESWMVLEKMPELRHADL